MTLLCHPGHVIASHALRHRPQASVTRNGPLATGTAPALPDTLAERGGQKIPVDRWIEVSKVEVQNIVVWIDTCVLDLGSNLVMDDRFLVFADNINSKLKHVLLTKFVRFRVAIFRRETSAVDKSAVGRLDVTDPYLARAISPYLGMLPREHLGVEVAIERRGNCLVVCLTANAQDLGEVRYGDGFALEGAVERDEMKDRRRLVLTLCAGGAVLLCLSGLAVLRRQHGGGRVKGRDGRGS